MGDHQPRQNYHHIRPMASPESRRGDGSQFPYPCFCTRNHSYLHHTAYYHRRQSVYCGPQNDNTLPLINSNFHNTRLIPPPRSTSPCVSQCSGLFCPGDRYYNRSVQWSCERRTSPGCFQRPIPNSVEQPIIALGEPHGNYIRGGLPEMRDMGRLQNAAFESSSSLGFHMRPSCLHIEQRRNQHNPPPEVTSFSHPAIIRLVDNVMLMDGVRNSDISNRWFNNEAVPFEVIRNLLIRPWSRVNTAEFSRVNTDDGNRNFRPSIHLVRRTTNQDNSTPEVRSTDLPTIPLQDTVMLADSVRNLDGLTNEQVLNAPVDDWEELFDIPEQSGHVETGFSEETILGHLRTRTHISSTNNLDLNDRLTLDQIIEICVICQGEYENHEKIGTLQCGHEYHAECIMKWLQRKNDCPICKAKALPI